MLGEATDLRGGILFVKAVPKVFLLGFCGYR
jgi:hypothetical protein